MSTVAVSPLPRWDLSDAFPCLEAPEVSKAFEDVRNGISHLDIKLAAAESNAIELSTDLLDSFFELLEGYNDLFAQIRTLSSFIHGYVSTDSRNETALRKDSELEIVLVPFRKLNTRFTAWLGRLPLDALVRECSTAREHEFPIRKAHIASKHLMSPEEEALAAELDPTSCSAWERLHSNLTSQIEVPIELDGEAHPRPMSVVRNLAYDPDRNVRRIAYEAEQITWQANEVPLAACMNSIKGTVSTLCERRGWNTPLDEALFGANIDRPALDAMMEAAREAFPDFRRYMKAKAKLLGIEKLAFYDVFAPVAGTEKTWEFEEGAEFVAQNFDTFSKKLGDFARRSCANKWIDAEPRAGKQGGAFCMYLLADQSRILMNYKPSFSSVKTLAHELGHAYHNLCLADRTQIQRRTPMTLAETASIFCETIVHNAATQSCSGGERLLILEGSLQDSCQVVIDISSRFLFEENLFEGRKDRELSPSEMCDVMVEAQKATYGDGLDENCLHPYMWAVKPHYYSSRSFYNFPYMYGLLFGLGLYSQYRMDPEGFKSRYDDLLSSTGLADAASLGSRFGFNVRAPEFWRSSLDVIRGQIADFERLVPRN